MILIKNIKYISKYYSKLCEFVFSHNFHHFFLFFFIYFILTMDKLKMFFLKLTESELKVVEYTDAKVAWGPTTD